jgi:hypothetical protein
MYYDCVEKEIYMSRASKILSLIVLLVFLLACNFATQPFNDAQNLAKTAQAFASSMPVETLQAAASAIASAIPVETFQALPSAMPTVEALATNIGNMFDPQGTPVQEWNGIPIMPQASAGEEFSANNSYSFRFTGATKEVQDFYEEQLKAKGWSQPFSFPVEAEGGIMTFQKDNSTLLITITASEGSVVVLLTMS